MNVMGNGKIGSNLGNNLSLVRGREETMQKLRLSTYLGLKLGVKYPSIQKDVEGQIARIKEMTDKASRVAGDKTKNQYQKHLFARDLANVIGADIRRTQERVAKIADELTAEGGQMVESTLGPKDEYGYLYSEVRQWVRDNKGTPEGLARINEGYRDSLPIAAAIYHSPAQLLNMSKDVHTIMAGKAAELWAPKGWDMLNEGLNVGKAVKGYDAVIGDIYSSYYNEEVVAEAEASQV